MLHQTIDQEGDLCAPRIDDLAGAPQLQVDDLVRRVLDAVEQRLAVRVFRLAEVNEPARADSPGQT